MEDILSAKLAIRDSMSNGPAVSTSSPALFRLPPELRDRIWALCIGDQVLHIFDSPSYAITHTLCHSPISEPKAYDLADKLIPSEGEGAWIPPYDFDDDTSLIHYDSRHSGCDTVTWSNPKHSSPASSLDPFRAACPPPTQGDDLESMGILLLPPTIHGTVQYRITPRGSVQQLSLALMRVSRSLYKEIFRVLWGSNTFAFLKPAAFTKFLDQRTQAQRSAMRRLTLQPDQPLGSLVFNSAGFNGTWTSSAWAFGLSRLLGLKELYIDLQLRFSEEAMGEWWSRGLISVDSIPMALEARKLPLSVVRVYVESADDWHLGKSQIELPNELRKPLSKSIEALMLGNEGQQELEQKEIQERTAQWRTAVEEKWRQVRRHPSHFSQV